MICLCTKFHTCCTAVVHYLLPSNKHRVAHFVRSITVHHILTTSKFGCCPSSSHVWHAVMYCNKLEW